MEELELDLSELLVILKKKWYAIVITTLLSIIIVAIITVFFTTKKYESVTRILPKPQITDGLVDYTQLNVNDKMVNNYIELIKGRTILEKVANELNLDYQSIKKAISAENQTNTQIITIRATTTDPLISCQILEETIKIFYQEIETTLNITNITTIEYPQVTVVPVSPNIQINLLIGGLLGIIISVGIIFMMHVLDTKIKTVENAEQYLKIPVLGIIPDYRR